MQHVLILRTFSEASSCIQTCGRAVRFPSPDDERMRSIIVANAGEAAYTVGSTFIGRGAEVQSTH
jgi:hypothetical protein